MALIDLGRSRGQTFSFSDTLRTRVNSVLGALADWNDLRKTRKVLSSLSNAELDDIGLSRADVDMVTRHRAY